MTHEERIEKAQEQRRAVLQFPKPQGTPEPGGQRSEELFDGTPYQLAGHICDSIRLYIDDLLPPSRSMTWDEVFQALTIARRWMRQEQRERLNEEEA